MVDYSRIKIRAKEKGKTLKYLANCIGFGDRYFTDAKSQNTNMQDDKLEIIAKELNTSIEWLRGETDDPSPVEPTKSAELGGDMAEVLNMLQTLTPTEIQLVKERINKIIESR